MTGLRGGLRSRLISDSFRVMVIAALADLGWFDTGRRHAPIDYVTRPEEWREEVAPNTLAISPEQWNPEDGGLGNQQFDRTRMYIDFFSENEAVGIHLAHDLQSALLGLMPSIGRRGPQLEVFDTGQATPTVITVLDIEDVRVERAVGFPHEWQRHWFVISCFLEDDYLDDIESPVDADSWGASQASAYVRIKAVE